MSSQLYTSLLQIIPDAGRVTEGESILNQHGRDLTYHQPHQPDVVVFPHTRDEISKVLAFANESNIPVTPYGAGTSLEGHTIPVAGGISLDLTQMNHILEVRPDDFLVKVEPGVTRVQLNNHLKEYGLQFPLDPGADATLGGMASTNASGTTAVRYGVMRNQVLDLEVVLPDGSVMRTGSSAIKSSAGYNLTGLFVGSEGTLGVITELTLRLYGIPEYVVAARAVFSSVDAACSAAYQMIGAGMSVGRLELVDEFTIAAVNRAKGTTYTEQPTLFLEFQGTRAAATEEIQLAAAICKEEGAKDIVIESDPDARHQLWEARHAAALAILSMAPGKKMKVTDVCVPFSVMPGAIRQARAAIDKVGIYGAILGHVGDGNYHCQFLVDPDDPADIALASDVNRQIVDYALSHGGTCTGEHGVGLGKIKYVAREHADSLPAMRLIKQAFDPHGIMNPGKVFVME